MAIKDKIVDALLGTPNTMPINVQSYIQNVGNEPYAQNLTPEQIQGIAQGLNYGNKDVARMQQSLGIPIPKTPEELALAQQGKFNYQGRTGGILPDLGRGFQQNYNNNLVQSLGQPLKNPNLATTLGGGLGTLTKIIDSPVGRGLLAAGAVKALGGNGGQALAQGLNAGVIRQDLSAQDKLYRNQLQQMGIDTSNIRGNVNKDTFKNISDNYNRQQRNILQQQIANAKDNTQRAKLILEAASKNQLDAQEAVNLAKLYGIDITKLQESNQTVKTKADKTYKEQKIQVDRQNAESNRKKAEAALINANNKGKGNTNKPPKDADEFLNRKNNPQSGSNKKPLTPEERQQMIDAIEKELKKGKK